jgi:metal-responsive CopG/Arc/MetJ family transcriptional regulator
MANTIKTAISIQKTLFEDAETLAQQLNISRSHLFGLAIEMFVKKHQNQILLDEINQAYSDESEPNEKVLLSKMRNSHRKLVENEW